MQGDDELPGSPARASIGRILDWDAVPTNRCDLIAVITVLARLADLDEAAAREQALELWTKARYAPTPVVLGQPVTDVVADPDAATGRFAVHPAIDVEPGSGGSGDTTLPGLPLYVPRGHDHRIADLIQQAVDTRRPQVVVLVGGSSTGKTRACWEALHQLATAPGDEADRPPAWRVWRPVTPTDLTTGLTGAAVGERTVLAAGTAIWLNELQLFTLATDVRAGEDAAVALLDLLDRDDTGPVVVLGTIWRDPYWSQLKADHTGPGQDPHAYARRLARRVVAIDMPERTGTDRAAIEAAARLDPRWRAALREAPDEPVQFLAGAAHLLQRYLDATSTRRAVLHAAGDARRVGAPQYLPLDFLIHAARDYLPAADRDRLPPEQRDPAVWVRMALDGAHPHDTAALSRSSRGVRAPLHEVATDTGHDDGRPVYEMADYLEQHIRRTRATTQPRDSLWVAAVSLPAPDLVAAIGQAAELRGRLRPAARLYEAAAATGYTDAWTWLAWLREKAGDRAGAEDAYLQAAGNTNDWTWLAELREQAGDRAGRVPGLAPPVGEVAAGGQGVGVVGAQDPQLVGEQVRECGHGAGAEDAYLQAAGDTIGWTRVVAQLREQAGDRAGAEGAAPTRREARLKAAAAWTDLARLREKAGDRAGAEDVYRQAAAVGNTDAWVALARLRDEAGDQAGGERIRRFGITVDGLPEASL